MFTVAYDFDGVILTHSVPAANRVNVVYYSYFLELYLQVAVSRRSQNILNTHPLVLHDGARSCIVALWLIYCTSQMELGNSGTSSILP